MNKLVVISGGFHPFHAGHASLYQEAKKAFPDAQIVIGATNSQKDRPFPFKIKQKLAQVSGVPPKDFVEVSRQFSGEDPAIASRIKNPNDTILIFARSEKDKGEAPLPAQPDPVTGKLPLVTRGANKGKPVSNYLQYFAGNEDNLAPMTQHAYMVYLPTVEFGPGITSASEIRDMWPKLNDKRKTAMAMSLYPVTQKNPKLAATVVKLLDAGMGVETVNEKMKMGATIEPMEEDKEIDPIKTIIQFYKPIVHDIHKEKIDDYVDKARILLSKTDDPAVRSKLLSIFKKGKENPYIQGGIITTVGALLAGGLLSSASKMGLSPSQTNILLQSVLNTVIPTIVSRINGKSWTDTIKYTLASAGIGTGIAALTEKDEVMVHVAKDLTKGAPVAKLRAARDQERMKKREQDYGHPEAPTFDDYLDEK
jgi:hypothetical protein